MNSNSGGAAAIAIRKILKRVFKPKERISCAEWVEANIRLSTKSSATPGRYSLSKTPYLKEIYDDIDNPRIRRIVACKGAQLGLSQLVSNIFLFNVCNNTFPALAFFPSESKAQEFTERAFIPSLELCNAVKPFITDNVKDLTKKNYNFTSCITRFIGGGNANKFSSNNACIVAVDECDKYESLDAEGEANAIELAEARTTTYPLDSKLILLSTPTELNSSIIWREYLRGSQSQYFLPCPQCADTFTLDFFKHFKFPVNYKDAEGNYDFERVDAESFIECPSCKAHLNEQARRGMIRLGKWQATNPKQYPKEYKSYLIPGLISFDYTIGEICKRFLLSKGDISLMKDFFNKYLGQPHVQQVATIKSGDIDQVIKDSPRYKKGELHKRPIAIVAGVDTQGDCFWFSTTALFDDNSTCLIDWGRLETFEDLALMLDKQFPIRGTAELIGIHKSVIDLGGNRTSAVYDFCIRQAGRIIPIHGSSVKQGWFSPVRNKEIAYKGYGLPVITINDSQFKDRLYISAIKERALRYYLAEDTDEELKIQLSSERLIDKNREKVWICTNGRNHIGDTQKYILGFKVLLEPELQRAIQAIRQANELPANSEGKRQYTLRPAVTEQPAYAAAASPGYGGGGNMWN